jgi:hypothetical protein
MQELGSGLPATALQRTIAAASGDGHEDRGGSSRARGYKPGSITVSRVGQFNIAGLILSNVR